MAATKIAIIGGGVSGLGVAYEMRREAKKAGKSLDIHIFEASPDIGGNADTVIVKLGEQRPEGGEFLRWADLGVNDINLNTYTNVVKVMKEIGYQGGAYQNMCALENTETFFDDSANLLVTDDRELIHGASNLDVELRHLDRGIYKAETWIKYLFKAALAQSWPDEKPNLNLTVGQFFDEVISNPEAVLKEYTDPRGINWSDPKLLELLKDLIKLIFLPRIAAMYFADDAGPEVMLLAAPMCYYRTQEGRGGTKKADRRYFIGGSITWLRKLQQNLLETVLDKAPVTICFHDDFRARVKLLPDRIEIRNANDAQRAAVVFDKCVVTVHADDAAELLEFESQENDEPAAKAILDRVTYTQSKAYCHSFAGLMPADRNQWRSYNVPIRNQHSAHKGYSMTYVCNRHQNDSGKPDNHPYNQAGQPQFFITLNPQQEIPQKYILRQAGSERLPDDLDTELAGPLTTADPGLFYSRKQPGDLAITEFKHNLLDRQCFIAQAEIRKYNKASPRLLFAGGWSNGAGLQEECWEQAIVVAKQALELVE